MTFESRNERHTEDFADELALMLKEGDIVLLHGELGAGKTLIARRIVKTLHKDTKITVKSPTYTFLNVYEGNPTIYHFDFYRTENSDDIEVLGLNEYWGRGICLVEWPKKFCNSLPGRVIDVIIEITAETERKITANIPENG